MGIYQPSLVVEWWFKRNSNLLNLSVYHGISLVFAGFNKAGEFPERLPWIPRLVNSFPWKGLEVD